MICIEFYSCILIIKEGVSMAFKIRKKEEFSYSSPQEMYQDNKLKKNNGSLRLPSCHA